jgi:hypothetical protein
MKVGDHVIVVTDACGDTTASSENLIDFTGVITELWPDGSVCVDLDPEQDPEFDLTGLTFEARELEVIA